MAHQVVLAVEALRSMLLVWALLVSLDKEMLAQAIGHSQVTYVHFDGINLPFADSSFNLVTFAGSLFYAKSQRMLNEVVRVCLPNAIVIAYDFEVLFHLAHLLLTARSFYNYFAERYRAKDPHSPLVEELEKHSAAHTIDARLYATVYKVGAK